MSMSLNDSLELHSFEQLENVIEQAVGLLNATSGGIYQFDPVQQELTLVSSFPSNTIDESLFGTVLKLGEGIAGNFILSQERYYYVPDYANWPGRSSQFGSETFSSVIEMRLEHNHERLGIFYINDNRVGRVYIEKDIELLTVCSNYASMILYDLKRLAQESYQRNRLEKLLETNRKVMSDLSVSEVTNWRERLDQIIDSVAQILEAETGGFFVVEGDELVLEDSYGEDPKHHSVGRRFKIIDGEKTGLTGAIAARGRLFNAYGDRLIGDPAVKGGPSHTPSGRCYSLLMIPIEIRLVDEEGSRIVAWLRVDNKLGKRAEVNPSYHFTDEDVAILCQFADALAIAIRANDLLNELNQLFSVSPDPIVVLDRGGKIVRLNERAQELTGYSKQELLGQSVSVIYSESAEAYKIGALLREKGSVTEYRTYIRGKNGNDVPIRLSAANLYDARQKRIGSIGYLEDMRELFRERNLLRRLIDVVPVYIYAKDMDSRFLAANLETANRMGASHPRDLIGKKDADFFSTELAGKYAVDEKRVRDSGNPFEEIERTEDLRTGETRWLSTVKSPLRNYDNEIIGIVGVGHDVTNDRNRQSRIQRFFASSANLLAVNVPNQVLNMAVEQISEAENAQAVKLILIDDEDRSYDLFTTGHFEISDPKTRVRPNGISLFVKHTHNEVVIPDTSRYPSTGELPPTLHPDMLSNQIGSAFCLPVTSQQKTIGVLWVHYSQSQDFKEEDIQIIRIYLNQAASTYGLLQQLQRESAVANIQPELTRPEPSLWQEIAQRAYDALLADEVAVYSYDWIRNELVDPVVIGNSQWGETTPRIDVVTEVVARGSALSVSRISNGGGSQESMQSIPPRVKSYIAAPIHYSQDTHPLGAICVSYETPRIFYMEDEIALAKFAERAALVLHNVKLHQQIERHQQQLNTLQRASQVIVESRDPSAILREVARQALLLIDKGIERYPSKCFSYIGLIKDSETLEFVTAYPPEKLDWLNNTLQSLFGKPSMRLFVEPNKNSGISAMACLDGQYKIVNDVLLNNDYLEIDGRTGSQLSIPLKYGANVLGVLTIEHQDLEAFTEEDANRLRTLTNQAAVTIDRLHRLDQNNEAFRFIANITGIADNDTEELMLTRIAETIRKILKCDLVSIYIVNQISGREISLGAIVGAKGDISRHLEPFEDSVLVAQILEEERPRIVYDDNPFFTRFVFMRDEGIRSFITLPLEANDRKVGFLFASYRVREQLDPKLDDVIQLAIPAAVAVQNIQLLTKERYLRVQAETLNRINRILNRISQADALKDIAGDILDALREYIQYDKATFQLVQGDRRILLDYRNLDEKSISQYLLRPISTDRLVRRILKSGEITILSDLTEKQVREDWNWEIFPETENVRSWIGIPLILGEEKNRKPVGFITLDHTIPGYYQSSDNALREIVAIFAQQAAIAIRKSQLNNDLKLLDEIGKQLSANLSEQEIAPRVYHLTSKLMDTSNFFLGMYNRHTNQIDIEVWYRNKELLASRSYTLQGFTKHVLETGQALLVHDLDEEGEILPAQPAIITERQLSWLGVPIFAPSKRETIGIISTQSPERNAFDDYDRYLLQIIATWTGLAFENARRPIYDENRVDSLRRISASISSESEEWLYSNLIAWCEQLMDGADLVEIRLVDFHASELFTLASNNMAVKPEFKRVSKGRGVTGWVAEHGEECVINDLHQYEGEYLAFVDGMRSELAVPIFDRWRNVIGVLNIEHSEVNKFSSGEIIFAKAIAGLVGVAIESYQLNRQLNAGLVNIAEQEREMMLDSVESDLVHTIRNLAGLIIPRTELIREALDAQGVENDLLDDYLEQIAADARRIIQEGPQLREMLTGSNKLDLRVIVGNSVADAELIATDVVFRYEAEEELPEVRGNRRLLSTAVDNIIHNAIRAVRDRTKPVIDISVNAVRDDRNDPSGIQISITDNGVGIPDSERGRVFEYGYSRWHGDDVHKRGYGLWRAQMIVEKFGGHISLGDTVSGQGSTFTIFLPISPFQGETA